MELILHSHLDKSFLELIQEENLDNPLHSQLVDFVCEYAIAQLWRSWDIEPAIMMGYGTGNYAVLVLAEILTLDDIISLILKKEDLTSTQNFRPAKISIVSSVTGNTIQNNQIINSEQWQKEFDFTKSNINNLPNSLLDSSQILLDICSIQVNNPDIKTIDDYNIKNNNLTSLFSILIKFWLMGIKIDWSKVGDYKQCTPISLPTYPFERQSYWINVPPKPTNNQDEIVNQNKLERLAQEFVSPRNKIEQQLAHIWQRVLGHKFIGVEDNFFELGGSSLLAGKLFIEIEKALKIKMPISAIFQAPTIEELTKVLRQEKNISSLYSLVPIQPKGSRPILFAIHWLHYTRDLSKYLGEDQPIYGLNFGMGHSKDNVTSLTTIEELAKHYIEEIQALQPKGPYFLMGYSFGGLVAYEMAQQLSAKGEQIRLLALFDTYTKWSEKLPIKRRLINIFSFPRKSLKIMIKTIKNKIQHLLKLIKQFIGTYERRPNVPIIYLVQNYTPKIYLGRVLFFKARDLFSISYKLESPEVNLQKLVMGSLEIYEIPGNHDSMLKESNLKLLAEKLASHLVKNSPD